MLIAEASVPTERASRYLVQLCRHVKLVARTHQRLRAHAEWSDNRGVISFGEGRCTLRADPGGLSLRAEAPDEESLHQLEQRVADRLEQVGRRDRLAVTWGSPQGAEEWPPKQPTGLDRGQREDAHMTDRPRFPETGEDRDMAYERESTRRVPRWVKVLGIVVVVVAVLVVVMLLIGGGGDGGHGPSRHG